MIQTGFDLPRAFDLSYMWPEIMSKPGRIDLINRTLRFVSDLSFVIWNLFVIWDLRFGIYAVSL
jgi:hypothetical protein